MYFSFSEIFSFLAIFQVLQCAFLIFHVLQWFCNFSSGQVDFSHFPWFSVFLPIYHVLEWTFLNYPTFSVFLAIFHVLKYVFLIFRDFHFSRHIPVPTVCISHFSRYAVILSFFKSSGGCFSFFMIFNFLAIFHVLQRTFQYFPPFSVFLTIFHVLKCVFLIFRDFQISRHIPGPTVSFSHFSRFSVISSFFKW